MQCYSVAVIGYRVATFNDCAAAAEELKQVCSVHFVIELLMYLQTDECCCSIALYHALCDGRRYNHDMCVLSLTNVLDLF